MNLNLMTVSELRKLAAQFGIAGRSTMKKAELIAALSADEFAGSLEIMGGVAELEAEEREMNEISAEIVAEKSHVEALTADKVVPAGMFDPELTYYADGTHVVMRAQGTEQRGVAVGMTTDASPYQFQAVRFADGTVKNVAPHVLHRDEIAEQAAYIEEGIEIDEADDVEQADRASYYSETVPCFERTTVDGIGYGCVKLGEHVEHNTALGAAWWVATEADEQADTEAGELLEAVLGERADSSVTVTVDRYTEGRASVKMQGHDFGDMTREAYRIGRKWELIDQEHGIVFFTIRAGSLQKAVKAWAKKLNTHADRIDVARSF